MPGLRGNDEWRWYLRDHRRWKWPLIGATVGVWLSAMVMLIPWQPRASMDNVGTGPATTEHGDDAEPVETFDPTTTAAVSDTTELVADVETLATSIDAVAEADVVQSLTPGPPTSVEGEAEVTETTETSRRRPTRTDRTAAPATVPPPIPDPTSIPSPFVQDTFTAVPPTPTTTVPPPRPTTSPTTVRPTTTTTTVRPTTTTEPPPPPTTEPPPPPTTEPPPPPTTEPPPPPPPPLTTEPAPPPPPDVPSLIDP